MDNVVSVEFMDLGEERGGWWIAKRAKAEDFMRVLKEGVRKMRR